MPSESVAVRHALRWLVAAVAFGCLACGDDTRPPPPRPDAAAADACVACPSGASCVAGVCVCDPPLELCDGACVELQSAAQHCGACGNVCAPGTPCNAGRCACDPPSSVCTTARGDQECADLSSSTSHCGACGNRCAAGATCTAGACACAAGQMPCAGDDGRAVCTNPMTSVLHCGGCGMRCGVGAECAMGACTCPPGRMRCAEPGAADRCADLQFDDNHCGRCGARCGPTEVCHEAECVDACPVGTACSDVAECRMDAAALPDRAGAFCIAPSSETVTVDGTSWDQSYWSGGYCIEHYGGAASDGACDPAVRASCDACSRCVALGTDPVLGVLHGCLRRCDPGLGDWRTSNGGCRPGYDCNLGTQLCLPGCTSDEECRASFVDMNANGARDPGETTYDAASPARCDRATGRCVDRPFDPRAEFGDPCTTAAECPENGECLGGLTADGYCSRIACELAGRECGVDGACLAPFNDATYGVCLDACVAGDETDMAAIMGSRGGDPDCRPAGSRCYSLDGTASGGCMPGIFNDIVEPNVGADCTSSAECWSPYGNGTCYLARGRGFCTVVQCGIAPFALGGAGESALCPRGTVCHGDPTFFSFCLPSCDPALGAMACREGYACTPVGDPRGFACFPACRDVTDCGPEDVCDEGICHR